MIEIPLRGKFLQRLYFEVMSSSGDVINLFNLLSQLGIAANEVQNYMFAVYAMAQVKAGENTVLSDSIQVGIADADTDFINSQSLVEVFENHENYPLIFFPNRDHKYVNVNFVDWAVAEIHRCYIVIDIYQTDKISPNVALARGA